MKHINYFNINEKQDNKTNEDNRPIISYDFDGTLHLDVVGYDPISLTDWSNWKPFTEMFVQMKKDAKNHKIVITTARPKEFNKYVWDFIHKYNLPVEEVIATNNKDKAPYLKKMGVIKHYDDKNISDSLKGTGIHFVLVDPKTRTQQLIESLDESIDNLKKFELTFSSSFFVSNNTIQAFIKKLEKLDNTIILNKEIGSVKNGRILYLKSKTLDIKIIKELISNFIENYDYLKIEVVQMKN